MRNTKQINLKSSEHRYDIREKRSAVKTRYGEHLAKINYCRGEQSNVACYVLHFGHFVNKRRKN